MILRVFVEFGVSYLATHKLANGGKVSPHRFSRAHAYHLQSGFCMSIFDLESGKA
jgi:hypothetical protein